MWAVLRGDVFLVVVLRSRLAVVRSGRCLHSGLSVQAPAALCGWTSGGTRGQQWTRRAAHSAHDVMGWDGMGTDGRTNDRVEGRMDGWSDAGDRS